MELLTHDFDGNALIRNEGAVRNNLQEILLTPEEYHITGYTRQAFSTEIKRTLSRYHCFYVVTGNDGEFFTLSFNGTKKATRSEGAWAINTEKDIKSYAGFISGPNEWDVQEILINNGINTEMTIEKILYRIDNNFNYYYNDHRNKKKGSENCITALKNTLVENL